MGPSHFCLDYILEVVVNGENARTSNGMLYGAYVGKIKYYMDHNLCIPFEINGAMTNVSFMMCIIKSINDKDHLCLNDIRQRVGTLNIDGSVQYAISPLAFADIFGLYGHELDDVVKQVAGIANQDEKVQLLCVELIHLLHDILWFKIDKDGILKILPELDVLEPEVVCSESEKDIFFAALWSFIFSDDYESCYEKASHLKNTNSDIVGLACTFAGLYYDAQSIPTDWFEQVFDNFGYIKDGTPMIPVL